jgi:phosphate uptake regulator
VTDILFWMGDMDYHNGSMVKEARNALQNVNKTLHERLHEHDERLQSMLKKLQRELKSHTTHSKSIRRVLFFTTPRDS